MSELTKSQYLGLEKESLKMEIKVKYFPGQDKKIQFIDKGDWIDVYANEDVFIPKAAAVIHKAEKNRIKVISVVRE